MKHSLLLSLTVAVASLVGFVTHAQSLPKCAKVCVSSSGSVCCPGYTMDEFGNYPAAEPGYETPAQRCQTILNQPAVDLDSALLDELKACKNVAKQAQEDADAEAKALAELEAEKAKLRAEKAATQKPAQPVAQPQPQPAPAQPAHNFVNFSNFGAQPGEMPLIQDPYSQSQ